MLLFCNCSLEQVAYICINLTREACPATELHMHTALTLNNTCILLLFYTCTYSGVQAEFQERPVQLNVRERLNVTVSCTVVCQQSCSSSFEHDWILILPKLTDDSPRDKMLRDEDEVPGLNFIFSSLPDHPCNVPENEHSFNLSITVELYKFFPNLTEFSLMCGIVWNSAVDSKHDFSRIHRFHAIDDTLYNVSSQGIDEDPYKIVNENDNVSLTCTKLVSNLTTPIWQLSSSNTSLNNVSHLQLSGNDSEHTIHLDNGDTVTVTTNGTVRTYNMTDDISKVQDFSITLRNVPIFLGHLRIWCGVASDYDLVQFYNHSQTVTVKSSVEGTSSLCIITMLLVLN